MHLPNQFDFLSQTSVHYTAVNLLLLKEKEKDTIVFETSPDNIWLEQSFVHCLESRLLDNFTGILLFEGHGSTMKVTLS